MVKDYIANVSYTKIVCISLIFICKLIGNWFLNNSSDGFAYFFYWFIYFLEILFQCIFLNSICRWTFETQFNLNILIELFLNLFFLMNFGRYYCFINFAIFCLFLYLMWLLKYQQFLLLYKSIKILTQFQNFILFLLQRCVFHLLFKFLQPHFL